MGYRVYTTFGGDQITMVYDSKDGILKGAVLGDYLGALRTGSIGAVSTKYMSNPDSKVMGIIGTGSQAFTQAITSASVRDFREIHVYSLDSQHRRSFAERLGKMTGIKSVADESSADVARSSNVLILATTSRSPVVKYSDINQGTHIITVGRKSVNEHELDYEIAWKASVIASDSLLQLHSYDPPHFLSKEQTKNQIVELSDIVSGKIPGRKNRDDITLFLSVGLSGTEVALADYIIQHS
jgi:ornithine cyclodeaminase/alanine dehydrogenase-like protein (mu-crystallin family)